VVFSTTLSAVQGNARLASDARPRVTTDGVLRTIGSRSQ
jgi:hypothetical protein